MRKVSLPNEKRRLDRLLPLLIFAIPLLIYLPSLKHGFVWDDWSIIFKELQNVKGLSLYKPGGVYYRPVTTLIFLIDQMIWKTDPLGYHLSNIILHALNSCLLFILVKSILEVKMESKTAQWLGLLPALIFSIYPIHVESVSWIAGRTDLVVTLFVLLTFLSYHLYRVTRNARGLIPTFLFFVLAMGSKETGVMTLLLILLWEALVAPHLYGNRDRKAIVTTLAMGIVFTLYVVSRLPGIESYTGGFQNLSPIPLTKAFGYYLRYLLIPYPVLCYISRVPNGTLYLAISLFTILLLATGAVLANKLTWWARGVSFSLSTASIAILPSLALIAFGIGATPLALRYLYLPSAFFCLGIAFVLAPIAKTKGVRALTMGAGIALLLFAPLTLGAQAVWKNDLTFWKEAVKLAPDRAIPHNQLGLALAKEGRMEKARLEFEKALKAPDIQAYPWEKSKIYTNLGRVYLQLGKPKLALKALNLALKLNPNARSPYCVKARVYLAMYRHQNSKQLVHKAYQNLKNCISHNPTPENILLTARLAFYLKDKKEARRLIKILIKQFPESKEARKIIDSGSEKKP